MPKVIDIIGNKYGRLTVIKKLEERGNRGQIRFECKCDCGKIHQVTGESLRGGKSKSCGCFRDEVLKDLRYKPKKDRKRQILNNQFRSSRFKKIGCDLTFEDFEKLSYGNCYYCGQEPNRIIADRRCDSKKQGKISNETIKINGIDRIDSNGIYSKENTVSCCKNCNTAKSIMKQEEFFKWIKKVYEFNELQLNNRCCL